MDGRFGGGGIDRHAADGIDIVSRRDPADVATAAETVAASGCVAVMMAVAVAHNMGAAAEAHHEKDQRSADQEV